MNTYRDLEIYRVSELAVDVHLLSKRLPKFEMYDERNQIRKLSKAVTSMMVEG